MFRSSIQARRTTHYAMYHSASSPDSSACVRNVDIEVLLTLYRLQVIVGANGSGKSTALKLIVRLHDPDEGQILLGGHDIRTLRLRDLRQAISVLFQDYTHFPLSVRAVCPTYCPTAAPAPQAHPTLCIDPR